MIGRFLGRRPYTLSDPERAGTPRTSPRPSPSECRRYRSAGQEGIYVETATVVKLAQRPRSLVAQRPALSQLNVPVLRQPNVPVLRQPNVPVLGQPNVPVLGQPNVPVLRQPNDPPHSQPNDPL